MTEARREVTIQPVVSWPRNIQLGASYLVIVDVRLPAPAEEWPYEQEEFIVGCMLDGGPACRVRALGTAGVVLHRFGGTYGPARFIADVSRTPEDLDGAALWLTLTTEGGVPFYLGKLPMDGTSVAGAVLDDLPGVPLKIEPGAAEVAASAPPRPRVPGAPGTSGAGVPAADAAAPGVPALRSRTSPSRGEPIRISATVTALGQRLVIDLTEGGGDPGPGGARELTWPLDGNDLEDLRWYLEDYLSVPFGVYEERGEAVAASIDRWGHAIFEAVFGTGPARDAYQATRGRGGTELVIRSSSAAILGLPWELMLDPGRASPLALDMAGMSRSLLLAPEGADTVATPGGRLRVLMVISRPAGARDVGYQMIARPLLERLEAVSGQVDLKVLRPPTLAALQAELAAAAQEGTPYQIVHFDGHGALTRGSRAPVPEGEAGGEGVLVFEGPEGGSDNVPASRIAEVLRAASVPVVVLNSAQSGAIGRDLESAIATALLREGVAAVVAMAYSVYAVAAAEFVAAFYETIFAGGTVTAAVAVGRRRLYQRPERPSPKGAHPLADWLVPVHYLRREVSFPQAAVARPAEVPSLEEALNALRDAPDTGLSGALDPVGVFVGRDGLIYELEVAARGRRVVLLTGPAGTGKTELAKGFARWWRDTGGVDDPRLVLWHSFEPGVATFGLDGVIAEIGLSIFGTDFARLEGPRRLEAVKQLLSQYRTLLVWDNFESVRSMPDPGRATPSLDEAGAAELREFLAWIRDHSKSAVLITSRAQEDWLGDIRRIGVGGLTRNEAIEYADFLLAPYPAARQKRESRAFGELMEWLDGHPLSMRMILPQLDTSSPQELLESLRGGPQGSLDGGAVTGRTGSVAASIAYSYRHLAPATQRLLPALSLLYSIADAQVLGAFSAVSGVPARFAGATAQDWDDALKDAAGVGLVSALGATLYRVHPILPSYVASEWLAADPEGYQAVRDAATRALTAAYADYGNWLDQQISSGDAGLAYQVIGLEIRTLGSLLGYALDRRLWEHALGISRPLESYWEARGLDSEADAWADRARNATEVPGSGPPPFDTPTGILWLFFAGAAATRSARHGRLDDAERTWRQITAALAALDDSPERLGNLSAGYQNLGAIARQRGRLDEAEDWYRRTLAIAEEAGDRSGLADTYRDLGVIARDRGDYEQAGEWFRRSLTVKEEIGDRLGTAAIYYQLGMNAQSLGRLDEADEWFRKSLAIDEEIGNRRTMSSTYLQLGNSAQLRGQLDEAEDWYRRSLAISEELGDRPRMAITYHRLGYSAQLRGRLDEADEWYRRSLAINEELGDRAGLAASYGQLGLLAESRGQPASALQWVVRCVAVFDQFPHPAAGPGPGHLARLTRQLGRPALEEAWSRVTGQPPPAAVWDYIQSHPDDADSRRRPD